MPERTLSTSEVLDLLQAHGLRLTTPRRLIVEAVEQRQRPFSAEDLYRDLAVTHSGIGRATVFRTLDTLAHLGVLDRVHLPDGCHSYVLGHGRDQHFHHLICSTCGVVVPFEGCTIEPLLANLKATTDFEISGHMLEVFGVCSACRAA
jgi:Fur family ferric uptake transcriptional regulator